MRNLKGLLTILLVGIFAFTANAQSLSSLSDSELEAKKKEAIAAENYELANQIKDEQNARKSLDDKLKEKQEELKTALANEDYEKAEKLKSEIAQLEADIAKLKQLEEDKKIAVFQERYNDVMALEQEITDLKSGKRKETTPQENKPNNYDALTNEINQMTPKDFALARKNQKKEEYRNKAESHKEDLKTKPYNEKIIGLFNFGYSGGTYDEDFYEYDYSVIAYHFSNSRWWINKYLAGGLFSNFGFPEEGSIDGGAHITGFADFDSPILPYTSFGIGAGINIESGEFYTPIILRVGSNFFL